MNDFETAEVIELGEDSDSWLVRDVDSRAAAEAAIVRRLLESYGDDEAGITASIRNMAAAPHLVGSHWHIATEHPGDDGEVRLARFGLVGVDTFPGVLVGAVAEDLVVTRYPVVDSPRPVSVQFDVQSPVGPVVALLAEIDGRTYGFGWGPGSSVMFGSARGDVTVNSGQWVTRYPDGTITVTDERPEDAQVLSTAAEVGA